MSCFHIATALGAATGHPGPETPRPLGATEVPRRQKVLIADDSLVFLVAVSMKLRSHGYEVVTCQHGARVISLARSERPDLILLDINFPPDPAQGTEESWDGLVVLDWLHRLEETRLTPVMIVTGEDPGRYRHRCYLAGAVAFFEKPVRLEALLPAIHLALRPSSRGESR